MSFEARVPPILPPPPPKDPPLLLLLALPCVAEVELIGCGGGAVGGELWDEENRAAEEEAKFAARVWDKEKRVVGGLAARICMAKASWWVEEEEEEAPPSSSTPRGDWALVAVDGVMRRELL